jgi:hypothetical protein
MKKKLLLSSLASSLLFAEVPPLKLSSERTFSQSQYMPDISLTIDTSLVSRNVKQSELEGLSIPELSEDFYVGHKDEDHAHKPINANNGFNFNYAELVFSSNADPYFNMDAVFHFSQEGVEIEETYFTSSALNYGLRLRGGKFLSDFGRINSQHHHMWGFSDAPLIYTSFLGIEGLNDIGLQFQYTLPTDTFIMMGAELLQGGSETSFGNTVIEINGDTLAEATAPSLGVVYLKTSFDIGDTTILPGLSYAYGSVRKHHAHGAHEVAFSGNSSLYNAELTVKHYFGSYSFLQFQSEWIMRKQNGDKYHVENNVTEKQKQDITQSGIYTQIVYAQDQNWRYGFRYDNIYQNNFSFVEEKELPSTPYDRYTLMSEYHFSEFSRLRLQYDYNNAIEHKKAVQTLMLSINLSIGAHSAHNF